MWWMCKQYPYVIKRAYFVIGFYGLVVYQNASVFCGCLYFVSGSIFNFSHYVFINTQGFLTLSYRKGKVFVEVVIFLFNKIWIVIFHYCGLLPLPSTKSIFDVLGNSVSACISLPSWSIFSTMSLPILST